jgi:hypothetical protein
LRRKQAPVIGTSILTASLDHGGFPRTVIVRIAARIEREAAPDATARGNASFTAAQFLQMVVALPQRRALGPGTPMNEAELDAWARDTVTLLKGLLRRRGRLRPSSRVRRAPARHR